MTKRIVWSSILFLTLATVATPSRATPLAGGSEQGANRSADQIILAARGGGAPPHSPAWRACRHYRNAHQRHVCERHHMHG